MPAAPHPRVGALVAALLFSRGPALFGETLVRILVCLLEQRKLVQSGQTAWSLSAKGPSLDLSR